MYIVQRIPPCNVTTIELSPVVVLFLDFLDKQVRINRLNQRNNFAERYKALYLLTTYHHHVLNQIPTSHGFVVDQMVVTSYFSIRL